MARASTARLISVAALIALGVIFAKTNHAPTDDVTFVNAPLAVGGANVSAVEAQALPASVDGTWRRLPLEVVVADSQTTTRVRLAEASTIRVTLDGHVQERIIRLEPGYYLYCAILALLALAISIPYILRQPATGKWGPWYQLLSEAKGGYSLARAQLLLWFLPVAVLYAAFSFVSRSFMPVGTQLAVLLGLSGTTTMLGTATSPTPSADGPDAAPALSDLVTDWSGHGDLSRYQYLLLSAFGALVLVAAFLSKLEFPLLPTEFLYLVAASQGTYVATKAVKQAKTAASESSVSSTQSDGQAAILVAHAPLQVVPIASTGAATAEGSFTPPATPT